MTWIENNGTLHNLNAYREIYKPKKYANAIALESDAAVKYIPFKNEQSRDRAFEKIKGMLNAAAAEMAE